MLKIEKTETGFFSHFCGGRERKKGVKKIGWKTNGRYVWRWSDTSSNEWWRGCFSIDWRQQRIFLSEKRKKSFRSLIQTGKNSSLLSRWTFLLEIHLNGKRRRTAFCHRMSVCENADRAWRGEMGARTKGRGWEMAHRYNNKALKRESITYYGSQQWNHSSHVPVCFEVKHGETCLCETALTRAGKRGTRETI